jgi:hypothetical protein
MGALHRIGITWRFNAPLSWQFFWGRSALNMA